MELISQFKKKRKKAREFIRDYKDGKQVVVNRGYKGEDFNEIKVSNINKNQLNSLDNLTEEEINKLKISEIEKRKILTNIRRKNITNDLDRSRIFRNYLTPVTALSREIRYLPLSIKHGAEAYENITRLLQGRKPVSVLDRVDRLNKSGRGILGNAISINKLKPKSIPVYGRTSNSYGFDKDNNWVLKRVTDSFDNKNIKK